MSEAPDEHHADSTSTITENTTDKKKLTLGEELWRVHVNRAHFQAVTPDDLDREVGGTSSCQTKSTASSDGLPHRSVGEELWEVHCKRARGALDEDYSNDDDHGIDDPKHIKRNEGPHEAASMETTAKVVHHLRNRDVIVGSP